MEDNTKKSDLVSSDIKLIVAENLSKLREFYGINQIDLSDKIKTYQAAYSLSEQGTRELNYTNLYYLAVELGININWLFGLSDVRIDPTARKKHLENIKKRESRRRGFTKKKK